MYAGYTVEKQPSLIFGVRVCAPRERCLGLVLPHFLELVVGNIHAHSSLAPFRTEVLGWRRRALAATPRSLFLTSKSLAATPRSLFLTSKSLAATPRSLVATLRVLARVSRQSGHTHCCSSLRGQARPFLSMEWLLLPIWKVLIT